MVGTRHQTTLLIWIVCRRYRDNFNRAGAGEHEDHDKSLQLVEALDKEVRACVCRVGVWRCVFAGCLRAGSCGRMEVCVRRVHACWVAWVNGSVFAECVRACACMCVRAWTCACVDVYEPRACMTLWVRYLAAALVARVGAGAAAGAAAAVTAGVAAAVVAGAVAAVASAAADIDMALCRVVFRRV